LALLELQLAYDIPSFLHSADDSLLQRAASSAQHWTGLPADPVPPASRDLADFTHLKLSPNTAGTLPPLEIIHSPGHTPGSVCFTTEDVIFVGDLVFRDGLGRTDFSYSSPLKLYDSLDTLIDRYETTGDRLVLAGHGEPFWLSDVAARFGSDRD
jgi:glyoxylase-like metal-dependent hydrolase (beta-lactamase superfamily II)